MSTLIFYFTTQQSRRYLADTIVLPDYTPDILDFKENIDARERTRHVCRFRVIARSRECDRTAKRKANLSIARGRIACWVLARSHRSRENQFRFGRGRRDERNARETVVETRREERRYGREREEDMFGRKCRSRIFSRLIILSISSLILSYFTRYSPRVFKFI